LSGGSDPSLDIAVTLSNIIKGLEALIESRSIFFLFGKPRRRKKGNEMK